MKHFTLRLILAVVLSLLTLVIATTGCAPSETTADCRDSRNANHWTCARP